MSLVLVGLRYSGKTRVGELVAQKLGKSGIPFIDADHKFFEWHGNIDDFVKENGWEGFRKTESEVIDRICDEYNLQEIVLSPGGGAVAHDQGKQYRQRNVRRLQTFGTVIYLTPSKELKKSIKILQERKEKLPGYDPQRPALGKTDAEIAEERHPLYKEAAHIMCVTRNRGLEEAANRVITAYREFNATSS